jgi:hypothetical protein
MNEIIKRAREAAIQAEEKYEDLCGLGTAGEWAEFVGMAVIAALRQPTPEMIEAGKVPLQSISGFDVEKKLIEIWKAMHAAALADETATERPNTSPERPNTEGETADNAP